MSDIVAMARAAQRDDRLSTGALYGQLADEIERLREAIVRQDTAIRACNQKIGELELWNRDYREQIAALKANSR